jgi:hypothetical protein
MTKNLTFKFYFILDLYPLLCYNNSMKEGIIMKKKQEPKTKCNKCGKYIGEDCEHAVLIPAEGGGGSFLFFCDDCWELVLMENYRGK